MRTVYALETLRGHWQRSIFLAGPSPRQEQHYNWRPKALTYLKTSGFMGAVFVPLPRDGQWAPNYDKQIDWELEYLERASVIAFWMPRDLINLPGYTSNVEYGLFARSGKVVLGFPKTAVKMRYLEHLAGKYDIPVRRTLRGTLTKAISKLSCD